MTFNSDYEAYILYRIGKPQLMGAFKTLELARAACQEHYEKECFETDKLNWTKTSMAHVKNAYSYMIRAVASPLTETETANDE